MRTRRSVRNQDRLFRALFPRPVSPTPPTTVPMTDAEIDAMFWLPKQSRRLLKHDAAQARKKDHGHA